MVPSYKDTEWQVMVRRPSNPANQTVGASGTNGSAYSGTIQIRVLEGDEWRDYWVPTDPGNSDYAQYQEWLAEGNEPRIIF